MVRTGRTFADAADEYFRYLADDRQRKPSTVRDARSVIRNHLLPPFGARALEDITEQEVERWARSLGSDRPLSNATKRKVIVIFHGVMARACRVYGLPVNPVSKVEKPRLTAPGAIDVFSPEEVHALVRAAASEQDAAIFLTAAFTGLRQGELVALRWRDVDFAGSDIRGDRELHQRRALDAEERKSALGADGTGGRRGAGAARAARALRRTRRSRLRRTGRRPPRRLRAAAPLPRCSAWRRPAAAALPRSAPHLRHAGNRRSRHPARAGVDGPCRRPDHDALSPLRTAARRRCDHRSRVRNRPRHGPDVKIVPLTKAVRGGVALGGVNPVGGSLRSVLLCSAGCAAAFPPTQERDGRRSRGTGRLQLVCPRRASVDARLRRPRVV